MRYMHALLIVGEMTSRVVVVLERVHEIVTLVLGPCVLDLHALHSFCYWLMALIRVERVDFLLTLLMRESAHEVVVRLRLLCVIVWLLCACRLTLHLARHQPAVKLEAIRTELWL